MTIYELRAMARQATEQDDGLAAYAAQWDCDTASAEQQLARVADAYEAGLIVPADDDEVPVWLVDPRLLIAIMLVSIAIIAASILL